MFFFTYMFFFTNFSKKTTFDGIALKMLPLERAKKMDHFKKNLPRNLDSRPRYDRFKALEYVKKTYIYAVN